jgi:hypothetical protein
VGPADTNEQIVDAGDAAEQRADLHHLDTDEDGGVPVRSSSERFASACSNASSPPGGHGQLGLPRTTSA